MKNKSCKINTKKKSKTKIGQETSPDFLLSDVETASLTTFVLSDDETMDQNQQDNSSVVSLPNNNHTSTALYSTESSMILHSPGEMRSIQDYEETQQQIRDISIEADLHSKQPAQFHNMSNEFEIAYWLAHHKRILDLAINIRDGMANGINKESDMASTSTYALTQ